MPSELPLIQGRDLTCVFGHGRTAFIAVKRATFDIAEGETVAIVGESGSGKTTLARMILALQRPSSGELLFEGRPVRDRREHWRRVQAVFQDPFASFNQFFTVGRQLHDALRLKDETLAATDVRHRLEETLAQVNLVPDQTLEKHPFELSGGQLQRLLLARALLLRPRVLVADEPTSMVDACSRAQLLDILLGLRRTAGISVIFITHDIGLAYHVSDRLLVMSKGEIVEQGPAERVITSPAHEYTRRLLADIPVLHRDWLPAVPASRE